SRISGNHHVKIHTQQRNESGFPGRRLARDCHFSEYTTIRPEDHRKLCPRITSEWPIRELSRGRSDRNGKCGHFYVHSPSLYFKQLEQPDLLKACCVLRSLTG